MRIVGYILAIIGLAYVLKRIMHCEKYSCLHGWHKIKVEEEKAAGETVSHKIKVEEERKGSRYGSNPIYY